MLMRLTNICASPPMRKEMMAIFHVDETWHPYLIWRCFQVDIILIVRSVIWTICYHPWRNRNGALRCICTILTSYTRKAVRHLRYRKNMRRNDISLPYPFRYLIVSAKVVHCIWISTGDSIHPKCFRRIPTPLRDKHDNNIRRSIRGAFF